MNKRWKSASHAVYNCNYHLIWCPKYRRKVLEEPIDLKLKELLLEKAKEHDWVIESMEVMLDHVHIFIKATVNDSPAFIVNQLKGYTSFKLRDEFPQLKSRLPTLWTRSYYCETIGYISEETIKDYIKNQKNK